MELRLPTSIIEAELSKYDSSAISIESLPNYVLYDLNALHSYLLCTVLDLPEEYASLNFTDNMFKYLKETVCKIKDKNVAEKFLMVCKELSRIFDTEKLSNIKKGEVLRDFLDCYELYFKMEYPAEIRNLYDFELYLDIVTNGVDYKYLQYVPENKRFLLSIDTEQILDEAILIINKYEIKIAYQLLKLGVTEYKSLMMYRDEEYFYILLECLKNKQDISGIDFSNYSTNTLYNIVVAKNLGVDIQRYNKSTANKEILNDINLAQLSNKSNKNKNLKFL